MARSYTGARPLAPLPRAYRMAVLSWNFGLVYLRYKRIQRNKKLSAEAREVRSAREHERNARRLYDTATRLQGLLIKTCQFISSRADVAPPEYVAILGRLQDNVPPLPYAEISAQVERELGRPPEKIFAEIAT